MERWEYFQTSVNLDLRGSERRRHESTNEFYGVLNDIGSQGWEMVGFETVHGNKEMLVAIDSPEQVASLTLLAADSGKPELPYQHRTA